IVDPRNEDVVLVAALGHAFGPNQERGIFRTADGGKTWTKVLSKDENTGGIDIVFDPHNPNIVFASLWQARRQPWFFSSGGPGSGLYRSQDNGVTWKRLEGNGLPSGILGKIGVAVSGADSNRVYAIIEAKEGGLYRSDDAGQHWTRANDDGRFRQRAWYFSKVYADPKSADTVYLLNTGLFKSVDGGKTFNLLPARHGDHHGLWIIRQTQTVSQMSVTVAPVSQLTAAKIGRPKTTNRLHSFITLLWTTRFPTTFTARNRTTRMSVSPVARIPA